MYNFVGGKVEKDEDYLKAAYRKLYEEMGITHYNIILTKLLSFIYHLDDTLLEVYVGRLNKDVKLKREIHPLIYMDLDQNFFDMQKFAGEGNFGHIMEHIKMHQSEI